MRRSTLISARSLIQDAPPEDGPRRFDTIDHIAPQNSLGDLLRLLRFLHGYHNIGHLAKRAKVPTETIAQWEMGLSVPDLAGEPWKQLCAALQVTIERRGSRWFARKREGSAPPR